ncbi:phosphatase PAP2 family protein [Nocardioides KLBMP 9356]|uniref:Phosphatase PAP2 family protein n=1 Tax=Nocardioides potassii TaxID=2911371 RepID=A0ABS9HAW3_9ACTN|nr:phosphatase PAP2 family protein [Nocardioides potassii]MCF6377390.1 phosphatase PAP2 family protein [Nocardioides potassii]
MTTEVTRHRVDVAAAADGAPRTDEHTRHGPVAQLLIAWSPLSAILVAYAVAQWVSAPLGTGDGEATNRVGSALHVVGPARADEALLGAAPSAWLQERLWDGDPRWWDAVAALVYVTHFVVIPLVTAVVWFALRDRFREWVVAALTMSVVGIAGYVAYPAAPPWLAAERGVIGDVDRTSHVGWDVLHLDVVGRLTEAGQSGSNPVAAMPSLHAGAALLVALFLWPSVSWAMRVVLAAYAVAMALTLVYTGEHYVVDVLAGWAVAVLAVVVARVAVGRAIRPAWTPGARWRS